MSKSTIQPRHREAGSKAMLGKVYGHAARREASLTEERFAERRKRDASRALMMGVSARFIEHDIPEYLNGQAVRHG